MTMLVDSHCHLDFPELADDRTAILQRACAAGVSHILTIATRVARHETYRRIAETHAGVLFTVGTHPHGAAEEPDTTVETLVALASHPRCVAIGEAGLDYHYDFAPRPVQERVLRTHIGAARETGLPLVIHAREADLDMERILTEESARGAFGAVLHCFSSGRRLAQVGIELGLYVSFAGMLTFRRSEELRAIAANLPAERLLVETDAPYLAPQSRRGKRNEPAFVVETAGALAGCLNMPESALFARTTENFFACFAKAASFRDEHVGSGHSAAESAA